MIGLEVNGKPLMRAYSIVSSNYEEHLEFWHQGAGRPADFASATLASGRHRADQQKPTGTLVQDNLLPGKNLYLLSTGTGLAPFMSIIKDPEVYERYEK